MPGRPPQAHDSGSLLAHVTTWLATLALFCGSTSAVGAQSTRVPPGPERWLVQLESRSFELAPLRRAFARGFREEAASMIAAFETLAAEDQAEFRERVEARGGRVLRHWWLVDACLVEAPAGVIDELRSDAFVVRIERDLLVEAHGGNALDRFNHNADYGFSLGLDGESTSAVIAIMDSGIDLDMAGVGRPHRAFYENGDPTNTTTGGIGGSRIVLTQQIGALPDDDAHGHGTRTAAIAAGAVWGTDDATDGHAPGARIANYSIADSIGAGGGVFALFSTMTSAWQQMVTDAATHEIVVANNSFGGQQDPTTTVQQALDTAAWVADILICVSAGNSGHLPRTGQQSAVNGLAVAGVTEDTHQVYDFSSRGPVVGDTSRTYPDIAAIAWGRTPIQDCETVDDLFGLTSSASPRVAGAAMVARAANPSLRADETKAIVLASSVALDDRNPGLDRNAFGVGLMRQDLAVQTALESGRHARDTIQVGGTRTLTFAAPPGQTASVAIAWMRDQFGSTAWSDLALRVYDGVSLQTLATADSPRNLYEIVRFDGAPSGTAVAEVTANSIVGIQQEFAIGVAIQPNTTPPRRGTFRVHGAGCAGPVTNGPGACIQVNATADGSALVPVLDDVPYTNRFGHAIEIIAPPSGMTLRGFELLTRSLGPATIETALYLDNGGQPNTTPTRTGSMTTDSVERWYRTQFGLPVVLAPNQRVYLGVEDWSKSTIRLSPAAAPQTARLHWRDRCAGAAWGGSFWEHIGLRVLCDNVGAAEVPFHETVGDIEVMHGATMRCSRLPAGVSTVLLIGFDDTVWSGVPLPFETTMFGVPGCFLRLAPHIRVARTSDPFGVVEVQVHFGTGTGLLGVRALSQFVVLDPTSARPITFSNSGENLIGTW